MAASDFPAVVDPDLVGTYPALAKAGGGLVWDGVLEYRVWLHTEGGSDHFHASAIYEDAADFAAQVTGAGDPLALVLQEEYLDEPEPGRYVHMKERRLTEWPVEFLRRPRRTPRTIPDFLAPDAPSDRLERLRGELT